MANSLVVPIMLKKGSEVSQNFSLVRVHKSKFEYGALRLVFSHISLKRTQNRVPFFLWTPFSSRNILSKFQFFSQVARPVPKASVQLEFIGAGSNTKHLGLFRSYLPHSNSESRTIFYGLIIFQITLFQNLKFFLNQLDQSFSSVRVHWSMYEFGALRLVFSHISLIRTRNRVPFFFWTPYSSRNIFSKFQIFSQSA